MTNKKMKLPGIRRTVNLNDQADYLTVPAISPPPATDGGSGGQPPVAPEVPGGFQYAHEDAYQRLLRQAAGQSAFRYNPSSDPVMQAYTRAYRREGERATANALAQAAAATGGIPSSYAVGAAQQAGAYYASLLADKFPELEQQAYNRYLNERAASLQGLNALSADREDAYSKYQAEQKARQELERLALGTDGLSADEAQYIIDNYTEGGKVTNPYIWQDLLSQHSEEQLAAMGITYAGAQ